MRARLAIVVAFATLGLVVATEALADNPPAQLLPADGASFTASGVQIVFQASINPLPAPAPAHMDFYISKDPQVDANGVLANWFNNFRGNPTGDPMIYAAGTSSDVNWPNIPDTYYWQAVYFDCGVDPDCFNESTTRSFTITPRPASSVGSGSEPETFLTHHPRHRTHKRKVAFAFSSDVAGAHFQCFYAKGWAKCKSPHIFRHLETGRYRFQTRAVVNGVEDPDPASWVFKVLH
jgi:hypothetical protein